MPRCLHVLNGDVVADRLAATNLGGTRAVWADPLCEGPLVPLTQPGFREARARYLARAGYATAAEAHARLTMWDGGLEAARGHDEVVLWLEHDLFDQLLLVRHLAWWADLHLDLPQLSLICIGEFPGIDPFHGLGQLAPDDLLGLFPNRVPVSPEVVAHGARTWQALLATHPLDLEHVRHHPVPGLRYLSAALRRYLEEYPALRTGLGRTEAMILEELSHGPLHPAALFRAVQRREAAVFMGDLSFRHLLEGLARGPEPLLELHLAPAATGPALEGAPVRRRPAAERVLAGRDDWVTLAGIDRWFGGVHLEGRRVPWRWDPLNERIAHVPGA